MAKPTLKQIRELGNFNTQDQWYIQLLELPSGLNFDSNDMNFRCQSVDIPTRSAAINTVQIRGLAPVKQHGNVTPSGTTTVTLASTVDMKVEKAIHQLISMAGEQGTSNGRYKKDAEFKMRLVRMDLTGKELMEYVMIGCLLESYDPGGGLGATGDLFNPTMTFQWDDFTETILV